MYKETRESSLDKRDSKVPIGPFSPHGAKQLNLFRVSDCFVRKLSFNNKVKVSVYKVMLVLNVSRFSTRDNAKLEFLFVRN